MYDTGRMCMKLAGRDAGKICVILNRVDDLFVMIDGQTRRKKCNIKHLEPLDKVVDLNADASHDEVKEVFKKLGLEVRETKPKKATERKKKQHKKKETPVKEKKEAKPKRKKASTKKTAAKKEEATTEKVEEKSIEEVAEENTKE